MTDVVSTISVEGALPLPEATAGTVRHGSPPSRPGDAAAARRIALKGAAIRGSAWTGIGFLAAIIFRFGGNIILTRYLPPEIFGLMTLMLTFLMGVGLFSDIGIGPAIIQNRFGEEESFLNTAWTIQVIRGFVLSAALCALAWPAARFYHMPLLLKYLPVVALIPLIAGFNSTSVFTLNRRFQLGKLTLLNVGVQTCAFAIMIAWAVMRPSIWALIAGAICAPLMYMLASHALDRRRRDRFGWNRSAAMQLFHFGKWIFVSTLFFFLQQQSDKLMLGKLGGLALLGIYGIACNLVSLPTQAMTNLASGILLPALARSAEAAPNQLRAVVLQMRGLLLPTGLAATLALVLGAPLIFHVLYKQQWWDAAWMAQLLAISIWFSILQQSVDRTLQAVANVRGLAISNIVNLVLTIFGALVGFQWGVAGFIIGLSAGNIAGHIIIEILMAKMGINLLSQDLAYSALLAALCGIGLALQHIQAGGWLIHVGTHLIWLERMPLLTAIVFVGATGLWAVHKIWSWTRN